MVESAKASNDTGAALVTGAGTRIGAALARRLAVKGYAIIVHYNRSSDSAEQVAEAIRENGGRAEAMGANLLDRGARDKLIENACRPFGPLTLLVNNASVFEPDSAETLRYDLWDAHFGLHAEAPMFLARDFAAQLPKGQKGNIVNIVDERVLRTSPGYFSYSLSKQVLFEATRTLAQTLAPNIRVNAIGPGPTLPNSRQTDEQFAAEVARLPLQQSATPGDIADTLLYLLQARSLTGQMIALDGGEHLDFRRTGAITPAERNE
ncbi:MAG: SDR family oxidoreductase [Hyphomicrobiaceae bacterium]|nr:SDR family oxidoreductase [Hyphomicrobiaceae bacterium]MCC0023272.1 SDR family oxidoreductase [Hyphomicrobiaceae bacterium]